MHTFLSTKVRFLDGRDPRLRTASRNDRCCILFSSHDRSVLLNSHTYLALSYYYTSSLSLLQEITLKRIRGMQEEQNSRSYTDDTG